MDISKLHDIIEKEAPNICGVSIIKNNSLIYSDSFNGYSLTDCTHIMSATKSIVAILIGICIDKKMIHSIDDKVLDYFPEYKVKKGERTIYSVTIRHLLTMKAPYKGKGDPWSKVCTSSDWTYASLDFLGGRKGMTDEFRYTTVCLHILTGIITKVSGMSTACFCNKYLFSILGIEDTKPYLALTKEEHVDFTISKGPKKHRWFSDPLDVGCAGYGLCLNSLDMAKIGLLCLNEGIYNNTRVVSKEWIRLLHTVTSKLDLKFDNMSYGYLWWINSEDSYSAIGNSGNVIYINTKLNLVVGITSYFKPTVFDRIHFIEKYMLD